MYNACIKRLRVIYEEGWLNDTSFIIRKKIETDRYTPYNYCRFLYKREELISAYNYGKHNSRIIKYRFYFFEQMLTK